VLTYLRDILDKLNSGEFPKYWRNIVETIEKGFLIQEVSMGPKYREVVNKFN
jgi:hypothetical protein